MSDYDSSNEPCVVIERWLNTYVVPADHPAPHDLKARLDDLVTGDVAAICSQSLNSFVESSDSSVWLIRELSVDIALDVGRNEESRVAEAWGKRLAVEIRQVIARGEEGDDVLRFPSRAAYLAQLVKDISCGNAWGKWYYREFDSLRSLSASSSICAALEREPGHAAEVLALLATEGRLEDILGAVSELDAARIYRSCFSECEATSAARERLWTGRLLELSGGIALGRVNTTNISAHDQLRLFAFTKVWFIDEQLDGSLRGAIDGLLELRRILSGMRSHESQQTFVRAVTAGDHESAIRILRYSGLDTSSEELDFVRRAAGGDEWAQRVAAVFAPKQVSDSAANALQQSFLTTLGGIFLLGPSFVELKIEEAIYAAIRTCTRPEQAAPLMRHFLAIKCMGRQRASDAIADPGLKFFAGFDHVRSPAELSSLAAQANSEAAVQVLAETLADEGRISAECLMADLVSLPASNGEAIIVRDAARDEWIHASVLPNDRAAIEATLERSLQFSRQVLGELPRTLLLGGSLAGLCESPKLQEFAGRVLVLPIGNKAAIADIAEETGIQPNRLLRASEPVEGELEQFSLRGLLPDLEVPSACDLEWSLVARAVLKNFARRLIGFEASSPDYLFRNFLAGMSSVRSVPGKLEVQLPSSPLSVVLRLSGAYAQTCTLPWLKEKEICLRAPSD